MRVLVCGGRNFSDQQYLMQYLEALHKCTPITCIIQGEAKGADTMARTWAMLKGVPFASYPAAWNTGRSAGARRNVFMLHDGKPDIVIAFLGGAGTGHMCKIAEQAGVPLIRTWLEPKK